MRIQLFALLGAILMTCSLLAQRPRLESPTFDPQTGAYKFRIVDLQPLEKGNYVQDPFYNVFRIYGNGEYAPYIQPGKNVWENYDNPVYTCCGSTGNHACVRTNCAVGSHTAIYRYPNAGGLTYTHMALILSRKGNNPPPPVALEGQIPVTDTRTAPIPRKRTIPDGKILYLTHSHGYLQVSPQPNRIVLGEKSVFIISYKPDPCIRNDSARIYLFYGRKQTETGTNASFAPHQHYVNTDIFPHYIPTYLPGVSPVRWSNISPSQPTGPFYNYEVFDLPPGYVSDVAMAIGDSAEQRLFREVEYDARNTINSSEWSHAYAVLTTASNSPDCGKNSVNTNSLGNEILPLISGKLNYDEATGKLNGQRVIATDEILLKSGEPDDPNELTIQRICKDGTVRFRLKFCNNRLANASASGAQVVFRILNDNLEWCSASKQVLYPSDKVKDVHTYSARAEGTDLNCDAIKGLQENLAYYNCKTKTFRMKGTLLREECATIDIVLKFKNIQSISEEGSNLILRELQVNPVLEAKVWLCTNTEPLSVVNTKISSNIAINEFGLPIPNIVDDCQSECEKCPKEPWFRRERKELRPFKKRCIFDRSFWRFWGRKEK